MSRSSIKRDIKTLTSILAASELLARIRKNDSLLYSNSMLSYLAAGLYTGRSNDMVTVDSATFNMQHDALTVSDTASGLRSYDKTDATYKLQRAAKTAARRSIKIDMSATGVSLIIADIEQLAGVRTAIVIESVAHVTRGELAYVLKACFIKRFSWVTTTFEMEAKTAFDVINLFSRTRDLDLLIDYMKSIYDITHFPLTRRLFSTFSKFILYNWYFISKHCDGVGFYMVMSGKLSKQLLTRGQTVRLRLGKTSFGIVKNNLIFRYRQTHSETGAYGLSIYYFTKSLIYSKILDR